MAPLLSARFFLWYTDCMSGYYCMMLHITILRRLEMQQITPKELYDLLEKKKACLIDVREPAEHRAQKIEGAQSIPLRQVSSALLPSTSDPIVMHCHSGKRSVEACQKLLEESPDLDVYTLKGGITGWKQAGYATQKAHKQRLPLDQQTQLAAGMIGLSGVLMGAMIEPKFYWIAGFVCSGLIVAGLTGWCGMAKLLARMPWNQ